MGFLALDQLASNHRISVNQKGFDAFFGKGRIDGIPVFLAKPQMYMNLSGVAVKKIVDYFKTDPKDMIVIHDDLDLPFPSIRIKTGGGHAGHKGLMSIIDHVGDPEFVRVRFGIGKPPIKSMTEDYVLKPFTVEELGELYSIITTGSDAVTEIMTSGVQTAMNHYNERTPVPANEDE
jgi:PTH1 family peptidyl-tRNA hydrolase